MTLKEFFLISLRNPCNNCTAALIQLQNALKDNGMIIDQSSEFVVADRGYTHIERGTKGSQVSIGRAFLDPIESRMRLRNELIGKLKLYTLAGKGEFIEITTPEQERRLLTPENKELIELEQRIAREQRMAKKRKLEANWEQRRSSNSTSHTPSSSTQPP
ncbi:hypothetical protein ACJJIE_03640 [Microbulbifer sp. TRSA001]|uniref:hypothetical protein n=1 Tax=Microbulbifer sp. TRSA001 TaxID=3243381 RepID=UPI00403915C4